MLLALGLATGSTPEKSLSWQGMDSGTPIRVSSKKERLGVMKSVTESAVIKRLRRCLIKRGEFLKTNRSERWWSDLGNYYILNDRNVIVASHIDIQALARSEAVLNPSEVIVS